LSTLNYNLIFTSSADKVTAKILKLDKSLNKVRKDVNKLSGNFSKAIDKINSKLSQVNLHSLIQNVQSAATGFESLADPGVKLSTSLADLKAITDVTDTQLQAIEKTARKSAKTFGGSAAQGVESYKLILSQLSPEIAKVPEALSSMGDQVNTLSKTMGGDTRAATEVLSTAMNQYQVSLNDPIKASQEMSRMMNIMAAAAKEGSAELPQQKAALEQSGMAAKMAKVSFEETAAAIQVLDKAGKKGAAGGVALRNTISVLATGRFLPKDVRTELQAAGVDISKLTDKNSTLAERLKPLKKIMGDSALVTKLFGRENSNAALALINGIDEQERLTKAIVGTNTAYEQAAIVMDSPAEKNARLKTRIDDFKITLFNATDSALGYAKALGGIAFDISNLLPVFSGFSKMLAFVTNATKMQALWTNIVSTSTKGWAIAQGILNIMLSPVFLIPAIVIAIAAAIAWVISKTEGWGEAWKHTVEGGKLLFQLFADSIKLYFTTVVNGIMIGIDKIKLGWYKFKEAVGIGDSTENQKMIAKINADTDKRIQAIKDAANKVKETTLKSAKEFGKAGASLKWKVKTEVEDPTGVTAPIIPGTSSSKKGNSSGSGKGAGTKTNKAIATGGTKHNYITITLEQLIGVLNIKGNDFKDSAKQMQDAGTDALLRTLALATTAGS